MTLSPEWSVVYVHINYDYQKSTRGNVERDLRGQTNPSHQGLPNTEKQTTYAHCCKKTCFTKYAIPYKNKQNKGNKYVYLHFELLRNFGICGVYQK